MAPLRQGPDAAHPAVRGRRYIAGDEQDAAKVKAWFAAGGRVMVLNEDGSGHILCEGSAQLVEVLNANLTKPDPPDLGMRFVR